jgi:aspartate/methionine/tyrosine aminotransferase
MRSDRLPLHLGINQVAQTLEARHAAGLPLVDLTGSNPTLVGLHYPHDLLAPLADAAALRYDPQPRGLPSAREAVSREFHRQRLVVPPDRVVLTASSSEAYGLLFKLFANPHDEVLVPQPSYPLFEYLTALDGVRAVPYQMSYHGTWRIDLDTVQQALSPRTRALLVVSPNNPTGSYLHRDDLAALVEVCAARRIPLIGDEVFYDYAVDRPAEAVSVLSQDQVVTVTLGGLSKSAGLPQVKLGWMGWAGPAAQVDALLQAYEVIADSYLSVATPVQLAAPALLASGAAIRQQLQQRIRENLARLRARCGEYPSVGVLPVEGGWTAVVQVPAVQSEESLVLDLLQHDGVRVHPGYFFDFPKEAFLVISLIVQPEVLATGIDAVLRRAGGAAA